MVEWKQDRNNGMIKRLKVGLLTHERVARLCLYDRIGSFGCIISCYHSVGLKKKKEQFESELEELGSIREMQLKESEASGRISGLEKKIQYAEIEKVT